MQRLQRSAVERLMDGRPDTTLEAALEVFEVFASGSLTDEVYILEDVAGKRIASDRLSIVFGIELEDNGGRRVRAPRDGRARRPG